MERKTAAKKEIETKTKIKIAIEIKIEIVIEKGIVTEIEIEEEVIEIEIGIGIETEIGIEIELEEMKIVTDEEKIEIREEKPRRMALNPIAKHPAEKGAPRKNAPSSRRREAVEVDVEVAQQVAEE